MYKLHSKLHITRTSMVGCWFRKFQYFSFLSDPTRTNTCVPSRAVYTEESIIPCIRRDDGAYFSKFIFSKLYNILRHADKCIQNFTKLSIHCLLIALIMCFDFSLDFITRNSFKKKMQQPLLDHILEILVFHSHTSIYHIIVEQLRDAFIEFHSILFFSFFF